MSKPKRKQAVGEATVIRTTVISKAVPGLALVSSPEQPLWAIVITKSGERVLPLLADDEAKAAWVIEQLGQVVRWDEERPDVDDAQTKNRLARLFRALTHPRVAPGWVFDNTQPALFTGE
ncbi:hypothetical protein OV203_32245 [Nannocystis sp. ILAH1]|uniref:hypothetical protein n=1 Tax=Nannocystis sp. ILAH1 TaxID=2996789 RepID=UPI00227016EF|nr:hypothetical protein [Nannocystis sp. ILAH1]MCY0991854.1 hypothetical protein [Nannocystis sp. ILAH1]